MYDLDFLSSMTVSADLSWPASLKTEKVAQQQKGSREALMLYCSAVRKNVAGMGAR